MKCIIIGLGNFGMALAQRLTAMGYEVIGVDKDIDKVNAYKDSIKNTICLNLNNEQAARNLPLKDADLNIVSLRRRFRHAGAACQPARRPEAFAARLCCGGRRP